MGSVKYRSRAINKPLAVYKVLVWLMIVDKERARGAREDATDLSAKYRGLYGSAHIGVWQGGGVGENQLLLVRVGRPLTSGCRAYVFRVVPLKSCSRPWCGTWGRAGTVRPVSYYLTCSVPVGRRAVEGGAGGRWVLEGGQQAPGGERGGHPPPFRPLVVDCRAAKRCAATRGEAET